MVYISTSLLIGIFSSLLATFVFIIGAQIFRKIIIPWFSDVIYKGLRVDGDWKLEDGDNGREDVYISLSLNQKADQVTGLLIYDISGEKSSFNFNGSIQNMLLSGTAVPVSKKVIDGASILLHIDQAGYSLKMTGGYCFYEQAGKIAAVENVTFVQKCS